MRNIDQIVRDTLGNQAVQIIQLTAEIEALKEQLKQLEAKQNEPNPQN